jgi:hypothetical protein
MFNFRRRSREEVAAEATEAKFQPIRTGRTFKTLFGLVSAAPSPFTRTEIASGVNLYSAERGAPKLIVGFSGSLGRLNMAVFMFLEALDSAEYDLLLLADLKKLHFHNGIENYADSMPELMSKVGNLARQRAYRSIITYGTSMGGFPALRGGDMLGADRAISIGGRFVWHPARIKRGMEKIGAFDPICNCRAPFRVPCYLLYTGGKQLDVEHAEMLARIMPESRRIVLPGNDHNFPYQIRSKGRLDSYSAQIFDLTREPDEAKLRALLD